MVKAYLRYEHEGAYGVVASNCNALFDRSGAYFLTAALEGIAVWKSRSGDCVAFLSENDASSSQRPAEVKTLARAGREALIAAGYSDGSLRIWNLENFELRTTLHGHKRPVTRLAVSASGELLASGSQDTHICLWDVFGDKGLCRLEGHSHEITGLAFLREQQFLVSSAKDGQLKLWDVTSQHCCQTVLHDKGVIWSLALHPVLSQIVVGSVDSVLLVYELQSGEMPSLQVKTKVQRSEENRVRSLDFSEDGQYLACRNNSTGVEIFEVLSEETALRRLEKRKKEAQKTLQDLERKRAKGPLDKKLEKLQRKQERRLKESDRELQLYKRLTLYQGSGKVLSADFRPGVTPFELGFALGCNAFELVRFEVQSENTVPPKHQKRLEVFQGGHRSGIRSLFLSSNDQLLLSLSEKEAKVWSVDSVTCVHTLPSGYGLTGLFAPGDSVVVVGTKTGKLELYDLLASCRIGEPVEAHSGPIWSVAPLRDASGFVSGGTDGVLKLWKWGLVTEGEQKTVTVRETERSLKCPSDILSVKISPNSAYLAVGLLDATIQIYHMDSLSLFLTLYGHKLPVLSIDISADNELLVSGSADKNLRIWGMDFGDCHKSLFAHKDSVTQVAFVHTTHYVMSVGKDGSLKYWDADKFELLLEWSRHHAEVWCLALSQKGDVVFTGSNDRSLRKWRRTNEPFFLEHEKEKRLEALFDEDLTEDPSHHPRGLAGQRTVSTRSAADSILEALEIAAAEGQKDASDPINPLLCGLEPAAYVLQAIQKIKSSDLEIALLSLSFTDALQLLSHLADRLRQSSSQTETVCRVLTHLIRLHHRQLATSLPTRSLLQELQRTLRASIQPLRDTVGFNLEGLRYIRNLNDKTA